MSDPILPEPTDDPVPPRYVAPPWARVQVEYVPTTLILARVLGVVAGDLTLALGRVEVFPAGVALSLRLLPRPDGPKQDEDLYAQMTGYGAARLADRLRIGLRYADGRVATNRKIHGPDGPQPPQAAIVTTGAHSNGKVIESSHWAWPIPNTGDLEIVFAWPAKGLDETTVLLDGPPLREAADRAMNHPIWSGATLPDPTFLED